MTAPARQPFPGGCVYSCIATRPLGLPPFIIPPAAARLRVLRTRPLQLLSWEGSCTRRGLHSALCTTVLQGQLGVLWVQIIRFSRWLLNSYFYTHHFLRTRKSKENARREAATCCRKSPSCRTEIRFHPGSCPGDLGAVRCLARVLGNASTTLYRTAALKDWRGGWEER